jgi:hypothetical protein
MMKASKIKDNPNKRSKKARGSYDPLNEQNSSNVFYETLWRLVD